MSQGTLIAIEGTDGSGKATQTRLLHERLQRAGYDVVSFTFPRYDRESSHFVRQYLNGKYGAINDVNPYTCSLFYALDRYEAAKDIQQALAEGKVVLTDRYTGSNMAHQGTKFKNAEERRGYFIWNDNLEFTLLGVPRPEVNFVLRIPAETAQQLVDNKEQRSYTDEVRDLHETNLEHLQKSVEVYDDLCSLFPTDFKRIDCVRGGSLLSIDEIHALLWEKVSPLLPELPPQSTTTDNRDDQQTIEEGRRVSYFASLHQRTEDSRTKITHIKTPEQSFFTPEQLLPATKKQYQETLASILQMHAEILERLTAFFTQKGIEQATAYTQAYDIAKQCLPTAAYCSVTPLTTPYEIQPITKQTREAIKQVNNLLPAFYTGQPSAVRLQQAQPRNELDAAAMVAYNQSDLPLEVIQQEAATWTYEQKAMLLETSLISGTLPATLYTIDLTCSFAALLDMTQHISTSQINWQTLTPRNGYDVPRVIDEAGLASLYERCFDTSLELHSTLYAEGYTEESQYTTLLGHKVRCLIQCPLADLVSLTACRTKEVSVLLRTITSSVEEHHPIIGEHLRIAIDKSA